MAKKASEIVGMLWQSDKDIETSLQEATAYFLKKFGYRPERIHTSIDIKIRSYDGIILIGDRNLYSSSLLWLISKSTENTDKKEVTKNE